MCKRSCVAATAWAPCWAPAHGPSELQPLAQTLLEEHVPDPLTNPQSAAPEERNQKKPLPSSGDELTEDWPHAGPAESASVIFRELHFSTDRRPTGSGEQLPVNLGQPIDGELA